MVMEMKEVQRNLFLGSALAALILAPSAVLADLAGEISTAATHATLASQATTVDGVHMHLHHTLNCLVGPGGTGFDAKQVNPCTGSGNGAIVDTSDAAKKKSLEDAADIVRSGLLTPDLVTAQKDARDSAAKLKSIQ